MSGKSSTISQLQPAAGNLRIQTSVYGAAIALVYGTTRISGNLAWFGGFHAIPHTTTQSSGGKGGGGIKTGTTDYTYQAAVLMVLGEGPFNTVLSAWKGKTRYAGAPATTAPVQYEEIFTIPPGGVVNVGHGGAVYLNNVSAADIRPEPIDWTPT